VKKISWSPRIIAGVCIGAALLGSIGYAIYPTVEKNISTAIQHRTERKSGFMEDKSGEKPVDIEQRQKAEQDFSNLMENMGNPQKVTTSAKLKLKGHSYYIFGNDVLMPLDETWTEYEVPPASDGKYDRISSYYPSGESPDNWTQKFTIHKVNAEFKESGQEFMKRLITGVLVTLSDRMELEGNTLSKDDVSVNYIKNDENDTIVYWGLPGLGEVQFIRVFRSEQTNDLYVVTASYKMDIGDVTPTFAANKRAELASVQQLKRLKSMTHRLAPSGA